MTIPTTFSLPGADQIRKLFDLQGRTAVITGGASGLGRAIAWGMASFGADVAILDINGDDAARLAHTIRSDLGRKAISCALDMRDEMSVNRTFTDIENELGSVDILINGAGHAIRKPLVEMSQHEFDSLYEVHVRGAFLACKAAAAAMQRNRRGSIINIASIAGLVGIPRVAAYSAAKGALIQMTKAFALEMAPLGVRVNAIAPGFIDTPMTRQHSTAVREQICEGTPLGRFGLAEEIIGPAVFLASDASTYVTGATVLADGGWTAQ